MYTDSFPRGSAVPVFARKQGSNFVHQRPYLTHRPVELRLFGIQQGFSACGSDRSEPMTASAFNTWFQIEHPTSQSTERRRAFLG
jgi:hypothetical protein